MPTVWARLMHELGYECFGANGGDIGGIVTNRLAVEFPRAVHVHYPAEPHVADDVPLSAEEHAFLAARPHGRETGDAYARAREPAADAGLRSRRLADRAGGVNPTRAGSGPITTAT